MSKSSWVSPSAPEILARGRARNEIVSDSRRNGLFVAGRLLSVLNDYSMVEIPTRVKASIVAPLVLSLPAMSGLGFAEPYRGGACWL